MKGFIYVVTTVNARYEQIDVQRDVPTVWGEQLVFGPCKVSMRPKMKCGDYVFGVSPANGRRQRKILFAAKVIEVLSFAEAYTNYQDQWDDQHLKPICVRPKLVPSLGDCFPDSHYEHLEGAKHEGDWRRDILSPEHDRCFICDPLLPTAWLGRSGRGIEGQLLNFFKKCRLYGKSIADQVNQHATKNSPIVYRRDDLAGPLHVRLHLETDDPAKLVTIIRGCMHTENCQDVPILRPEPRNKRTVSRC